MEEELKTVLILSKDIKNKMAIHPALRREENPFVFRRASENDAERTYAIMLSEITLGLFGATLRGTIAHIENAVFNRNDITDEHVREWLQGALWLTPVPKLKRVEF